MNLKKCPKSGAVLEGHFILTSGRHSRILGEIKVMQYPQYVQQLCGMMPSITATSPSIWWRTDYRRIILAFEVARQLGCGHLCRKAENKTLPLNAARRSVRVITCWSSTMYSRPAVRSKNNRCGERTEGKHYCIGLLVDRSEEKYDFAHHSLPVTRGSYQLRPDNVLYARKIPLTKPGAAKSCNALCESFVIQH